MIMDDDTQRLRNRALKLLEYRAMSRGEMIGKLVEKGEDRDASEQVADWLVEIGFLNDATYAAQLVEHYAIAKGYGKRRVEQELWRRKIDKELWEAALATIPEENGQEVILKFIEQKLRGTLPEQKEEKRVTDALMRRGYNWDEIRNAMREYKQSIET